MNSTAYPDPMDRPAGGRDTRLDAIRGLMLILMTVDHFPGILISYVQNSVGFVTAAEGFIFLSGYVAGFCYLRTLVQQGKWAVVGRAAGRLRTIYVFQICTFLIVFCVMAGMPSIPAWAASAGFGQSAYAHPLQTLLQTAVLARQPMYFDILPMYMAFFLLVPAVIFCLRRKAWWMVLLASATVWLLTQAGITDALKNHSAGVMTQYLGVMLGYFNIFGWQVLFYFGMVFGYYRSENIPGLGFGRKGFFVVAALAVVMFLFRHGLWPHSNVFDSEFMTGIHRLGPVRVLNFALCAVILSRPKIWPRRALWTRLLSLLGRHSLSVFSFHVVLEYLARRWIVPHAWASQTTLAVLAVPIAALLYLPALVAEAVKRPPAPAKLAAH
ncbi:MAG: OpgC domain-containing protein [Verrucomicrobiota bacterium]